MKPQSRKIKLGYAEYAELPDDGKRYQILDGELDVSPSPVPRHQGISRNLFICLSPLQVSGRFEILYAPIDVILDRHTIVQPDLVLVRAERRSIIGEKNIQGPPDVLVEILSPSTKRTDRVTKRTLYARFGVPYYWIVDPKSERVELLARDGDTYAMVQAAERSDLIRPAELGGFEIEVEAIFKE